ncbi:ATP-binding protein [Enterococcus lemanii]|uniref:ATP-binding protein n=1 Tax=Enterococcus lemanii TaxID=1159752 RepID=A0ABV9MUZ1_9ENTE|nr:ATP-binding protein [Enterococcus lemanii]MBM7709259.1 superfamily I DNA and/or RNA helicase [Enterococcus lemanii]
MAKDIQQALEESLFKDLYEKLSTKLKVTLDVQFRMNPVISKLINNLYYQNITIEDYFTDKDYVLSPILKSVTWIDTNNSPNKSESKEENSFKNYEELNQINKQLDRINDYLKTKKRKKSVGIISGYDAQKNLLLDKVNRDYEFLDIEIDNVDAFQGSEKDIIIYSIVRSNDSSSLGFLKDERRLNVSLSRAKEHLIIIGDSEVSEYYPLENNPFTRLLKYIIDNPLDCALLM